ncbi:uncharacterized protein [Argopecten irradians]|uniref:uncharacterized protein n=1 Tax=Argopecten irradians TaxID=31199 RepID=UPI0037146978
MIKAVLILAVIGTALSQNPSMVYSTLPAGNSAAAGAKTISGLPTARHAGAHAGRQTALQGQRPGQENIFMNMLNNPIRLCRETENLRAVPCANNNNICNVISMMQYKMPNLLKCSPMGIGCCLKDYLSLHLSKQLR